MKPEPAQPSVQAEPERKLKIAYVGTHNLDDPNSWSGSINAIRKALERAQIEIFPIGDLKESPLTRIRTSLVSLIYKKVLRRNYFRNRDSGYLNDIAIAATKKLGSTHFDAILSAGSVEISKLKTNIPIIFWTDATFDGMVDFYPEFTNLAAVSRKEGHIQEQEALSSCRYALYTSEWARRTALQHYKVNEDKVKLVRYGANLPETPSIDEVKASIACRSNKKLKFLFVGMDWNRKGGQKAVEVVQLLRERGHDAELNILGARIPDSLPKWVIAHGRVNKFTADGWTKYKTLMETATFNILPSLSECCAVVFSEAAAFGVPSLASDVGGNTTSVMNGITGYVFPATATAQQYAETIEDCIHSAEDYQALCIRTVNTYHKTLNWDVSAKQIVSLINSLSKEQQCTTARN